MLLRTLIHESLFLQKFIEFVSDDSSLERKCDAYTSVFRLKQDPLLSSVILAKSWKTSKFQIDATMVLFLRIILEDLFHSIGKMILKEVVFGKSHCIELTSLNLFPVLWWNCHFLSRTPFGSPENNRLVSWLAGNVHHFLNESDAQATQSYTNEKIHSLFLILTCGRTQNSVALLRRTITKLMDVALKKC